MSILAGTGYDQIVSLGRACQPAHQIRRVVPDAPAHVFDWIITNDDALVAHIDADLDGMFAREHLTMGENECIIHRETKTQFLHEFPKGSDFDEQYEKNDGRYAMLSQRWKDLLASDQKVLFVRQHGWDVDIRATATRLRDLIAAKAPRLTFTLLYLTEEEDAPWNEPGILNEYLRQPEPYVWTGDNAAWDHVLGRGLAQPIRVRQLATSPINQERRSHVFICGIHRSGTSALHDIVKQHSLITGFSDTGKPKDEGQHLQAVLGRDGDHGGPGEFCFDPSAHLTERDLPAYADRLPDLYAAWAKVWDSDASIRVEKSPPNLIRSRFLQAAFHDARFVFIVRHPLAVARATRKWSHASEEHLFRHWLQGYRIMLEDTAFIRRSCCVRYEDLVARPEETLARVWRLAGVPELTVGAESFSDHNPNYLVVNSNFQIDAKERQLLEYFGYELEAPFTRFDRPYGW